MLKKFGKHSSIERFAVLFLVLTVSMITLVVSIVTTKVKYDSEVRANRVVYTPEFQFSRSGTIVDIAGVYTNESQNKFFILLHLNDISSMSMNAEDYQMIIRGADEKGRYSELKSNPTGGIYVFGVSGYMGLYMEDVNPFPSQLYDIVLRSYSKVAGNMVYGSDADSDPTFSQWEQTRMFVNPGGKGCKIAEFLNSGDTSPDVIYRETVMAAMEVRTAMLR